MMTGDWCLRQSTQNRLTAIDNSQQQRQRQRTRTYAQQTVSGALPATCPCTPPSRSAMRSASASAPAGWLPVACWFIGRTVEARRPTSSLRHPRRRAPLPQTPATEPVSDHGRVSRDGPPLRRKFNELHFSPLHASHAYIHTCAGNERPLP